MFFEFILFIICFVLLIYLLFMYRFTYWKRRNIPFIEPMIPFGNFKDVGKNKPIGLHFHDLYSEGKKFNYPYVGIYSFFTPSLLAINNNFIKNILIDDFQYFTDRHIYYNEKDDPLSAHLFSLDGLRWKHLRSRMTPIFSTGKLMYVFPTIAKIGERFGEIMESMLWNENIPHKTTLLELKELCARYTTDVISSCVFGIDCNSLEDPKAKFRMIGEKSLNKPRMGLLKRILANHIPEIARKYNFKTEHDDVSEYFMGALKETIAFRERNDVRRNDFLDVMINLKNSSNKDERISFEEIVAQAYIFFLAGFETSSTTLGYCLYELASNESIQEQARLEINKILEKYHNILTYEAVMEMVYVQQIIEETLRKYPAATTIQRKATQNYKIQETNDVIEKNQVVTVSVYGIHHDPDIYPEPEIFDPNRFSIENKEKNLPFSYLPFGDGPRNCIGNNFAKLYIKIGLISLLSRLKFKKSEKTIGPLIFSSKNFILSSNGGIWLYCEKIFQSTEL